jgi:tetratricopeptide (TPR) repeat protein
MSESAEKPQPTAHATLAKVPFPHLLVYTLEKRLTGSIELKDPNGTSGLIYVRDGRPSKVRLSEPGSFLGGVLHELGIIDDTQLNDSLARMAAERRLHGALLMEMGAITAEQLLVGLEEQIVRKLELLFALSPDATFAYYDGYDSLAGVGGPEIVSTDPLPMVWAAIRQAPSWEHAHQALSRVDRAAMRLNPAATIERFKFSKQEASACEMMRSKAIRLHEITSSKALGPSAAQLLVYCLMITKQLDLVEAPGSIRPPASGAAAAANPQAFARVQLSARSVQRAGGPAMAVEESSVEAGFDPRRATPYPPQSVQGVQAALQAATGSSAPAAVSPAPPPSARPAQAPQVPPAPTSASAMLAGTPSDDVPPPPSSSSQSVGRIAAAMSPADVAASRDRILKRAEEIDKLDYFQMLNVSKEAPTTEVQKAFFALAKTWHPDKLPAQLADVREQCHKVFARISEAHQTLTDPKRRQNYETLVKEGGATPDEQAQVANVLDAAMEFQKAEHFLKRGENARAEEICRKAFSMDPQQPDYIVMLAWLEALKPENQSEEQTNKRIAMLDEAIKINQNHARAYFYRGMLLKRLDKMPLAFKDFKKAMELDEHNVDAAREVRLYNMRRGQSATGSVPPGGRASHAPPPSKGGGLFGKLFKK